MTGSENTEIQNDDDREQSRRLSLQGNKPPLQIEGYSIVRPLGTGAYGSVWLAREDRTGRMVAIKYYPHRRGLNWSMLSREVEKLAAVYTSRNIVRLLDVGWNADPPYFVMEFVENGSLGNYLARGPLSVDEAIRITREICSALIDAHGAGVLHCDLKPDNVLLDGQNHARICDFGQSRMSHEQSPSLGTLYYMAPEQADLDALPDARWDVYAIGAMLYHMLTGSPPHRNPITQKQLEAAESLEGRLKTYQSNIRSAGLPLAHRNVKGVDNRLAEIVDRCLVASPAERLANAQAVRDELNARDRYRARRPLVMLGVVAPVLLTAAMVPIFVNALTKNLRITEQQITQRALESDALSARLQAAALEHELNDRLEELEDILSNSDVAEELEKTLARDPRELESEMRSFAAVAFPSRPRWIQVLDAAWEHANTDSGKRQHGRGLDTSWFLTDAHGVQLWRRQFSEETLGDNFAYRDYFHGQGQDFPRDVERTSIVPLQSPHVSIAYKSTTTKRQTVALSVPVKDSNGNVIGIFARTANLGDLQARLGSRMADSGEESVHRFIALAESRDSNAIRLLDHPFLSQVLQKQKDGSLQHDVLLEQLRMDEDTVSRIRSHSVATSDKYAAVTLERYQDPVGTLEDPSAATFRGEWMAAMAPVRGTGWMVIVQERRDAALLPVQTMAQRAKQQASLAVLIAAAMMLIVWFFVWRALSRTSSSANSPAAE